MPNLLHSDGTYNKAEIMRRAASQARQDRHEVMNPRQGSFTRGRMADLPWVSWLSRALKAVWQSAKIERARLPRPLTDAEREDRRRRDIEFSARLLARKLAERAAKAARKARLSTYPVAVPLAPETPARRQ